MYTSLGTGNGVSVLLQGETVDRKLFEARVLHPPGAFFPFAQPGAQVLIGQLLRPRNVWQKREAGDGRKDRFS